MVSGIATKMIMVAVSSGFSARVPAPAEPILDCAQAVARALIPRARAQSRIGSAGAGTLAEKPELTATIIILVAIPETMVILGFVIAAMILMMG